MDREIKNIVILRTDRIGEVLLSTVAVDAVRERYPGVRVSFVTSEYSRPLIETRQDIDEVITADTMERGGGFRKALSLASSLRKNRFDVAIVLNPHKVLHLACFLAGIPRRVGYDRKWGFFLTDRIKDERDKGEKHEVEYTMDLLREVDITEGLPRLELFVNKGTEEKIYHLLSGKGISSGDILIAVHPGSSNPAKIWPEEKYSELIRRIREEMNCKVAVLGSEEERSFAEKIIDGSEAVNLTGELDLQELAALLKRSDIFIGNDTGPMHMAAALDVPVIAIFGRNIPGVSPRRWRPWGDKHVVFHEDPGCDPCYDAGCPYDYKCLRAVNVNDVLGAAKRILGKE